MSKSNDIIHVSGDTQEAINASFQAAKQHYTPAGAKQPSKGIMNRLYKEAGEARARLADAEAEAATPVEPLHPELTERVRKEVAQHHEATEAALAEQERKATVRRTRSRSGKPEAEAARQAAKITNIGSRQSAAAKAEQQAAERVEQAIEAAKAMANDPYQIAMRKRAAAGGRRTMGIKVSDEKLAESISRITTANPDYKPGQVWKVLEWVESFTFTKARFDRAYLTATGHEPTRETYKRKAG